MSEQRVQLRHSLFINVLSIIDALPTKLPDDKPLHEVLPRGWPNMGDLRQLVTFLKANGVQKQP